MKIVLSGPKSSGKSTVGRALSDKLKISYIEIDQYIEQLFLKKTGRNLPCRAICEEIGEESFRELEKRAVKEVSEKEWCIIITGGSTVLNNESRQLLRKNSVFILLYSSISELLERLEKKNIPSFLNNPTAKELFAAKAKEIIEVVKPYADILVDSSKQSYNETIEQIINDLIYEFSIRSETPNTFGEIIRLTTFGESHGPALGAVLDGIQSGIELSTEDIQHELDRRRPGQSQVTTTRKEKDQVKILSGVFEGKTTGAPIAMLVENKNQDSKKYDEIKNLFRPGTADFTFWKKYGHRDYKGGGRASGRETISRVMGGAVAYSILKQKGIKIIAHTLSIGKTEAQDLNYDNIEKNSVRCADIHKSSVMEKDIINAKNNNDSLGGIIQVEVFNLPNGIGDPVFGKLDARLSSAIMSIGAIKGIEFGAGFSSSFLKGSASNDNILDGEFQTNNSGGVLGGISTGEKLAYKVAVKPTPSIAKEQSTCDYHNNNINIKVEGRHDPCIVPRVIPVIESMTALVILDLLEIQKKINPEWTY